AAADAGANGIVGAADGDVGRAASHQFVTWRPEPRLSDHIGERHPHLRSKFRKYISLGWQRPESRSDAEHTASLCPAAPRRLPMRPDPKTPGGRMVATRNVVHIADLAADECYIERTPASVAAVELAGIRTVLVVPMMKENELVGCVTVYRQEVRPFTEK